MGVVKSAFKSTKNLITKGVVGVVAESLMGKKDAPQEAVDPAAELEMEQEIKRKARQMAVSDLNPTGTLGAGKAQTTRSKVLGV